jgi:hypothetical protein
MSKPCVAIKGKFCGLAVCRAAIVLGLSIFFLSPAVRAEKGFVRVNQLGYELGAESRAYLMAEGPESPVGRFLGQDCQRAVRPG